MQLSKHKEKTDDYVLKVLTAAQDYATNTTWDSHHMAVPLSRAIVQHIFKALEGESRFEDCDSVEKLIAKICGKEGPVYGYYENTLLRNPEFYGFLCAQGYHEFADTLLREKLNDFQRVELLFYFFEGQIASGELKSRLVEFYKLHGPDAYLLWFKNNLNLYEFNGDEAVSLRKQIEETVIGGTTVDEVKTAYGSLLKLALRFRTLFVDNAYMAKMGLTGGKEKNGITSKHLFAYWHKKLFGMDVPIGFDIS